MDQYQITSDGQREHISSVIAGKSYEKSKEKELECKESIEKHTQVTSFEVTLTDKAQGNMSCKCTKNDVPLTEAEEIGNLVKKMLEGRRSGKATIKLEIDFQ